MEDHPHPPSRTTQGVTFLREAHIHIQVGCIAQFLRAVLCVGPVFQTVWKSLPKRLHLCIGKAASAGEFGKDLHWTQLLIL